MFYGFVIPEIHHFLPMPDPQRRDLFILISSKIQHPVCINPAVSPKTLPVLHAASPLSL
jgi:hypothetical protein